MKKAFALLPFAAALIVGCGSGSTDTSSSTTSSTGTTTASSSGSSTTTTPPAKPSDAGATTGAPGSTAATTPTAPAPASDLTVPAELRHEAFDYEGLANSKPVDMEIKSTGPNPQDLTGSQTMTLTGVKDGVATYSVTRTGGLEALGSETYTLKKDGVYEVKSSKMSLGEAALDLPADPTVGKSWKVHVTSNEPTAKMDLSMTSTVLGKESVKTAAGTFNDALVVEQTGGGMEQDQKVRTTGKQWYVKGIGVVKSDLTMYMPKNQVSKISIEVTHR